MYHIAPVPAFSIKWQFKFLFQDVSSSIAILTCKRTDMLCSSKLYSDKLNSTLARNTRSTYSVCKWQIFKESQTLKKSQISNPTFQTLEYSKRQGFISTVNRLLKFHCLNNGFHSLEFKSEWFNNDDFLNQEPFFDDALQLIQKDNEFFPKEVTVKPV